MSRDQGSGIPRWLTVVNLLAILVALAIVVPQQGRATHTAPPENLRIIARLSPTTPKLVWSDPSQSLSQGYILQRSTTADFSSSVVEIRIARNTLDFVDETLTFNKTFYYQVRSITGTDRSNPSNVAIAYNGTGTAPAKPAAPDDIRLASESGGLRVSWRNNATNEYGVWVQRSGDNGTTWEIRASLSLNSTSYLDNDAPAGAPMYRIWTFNSGGLSPSYAVQFANASAPTVPGVPTLGGIPSVPAIPTVPGVPTLGGIPSGLVPSNPASLLPTVPGVPTSILTIVPSNPTSLIPSVNPSTLVPALPNPKIWVGTFDRFSNTYNGLWILPSNCAIGQVGTCGIPKPALIGCPVDIPVLTVKVCYYIDLLSPDPVP